MNKEEFLSKRYAIDLKLKELNGEREQLEKEYIESNQGFPIGSKVCITVPAHERILVPEPFTKGTLLVDVDVVFVSVVATETRYPSDPAAGT